MRKKLLHEYFSAIGRRGGQRAAARMTKAQRVARAKKANLARNARHQEGAL